jgi:hypothetical protein
LDTALNQNFAEVYCASHRGDNVLLEPADETSTTHMSTMHQGPARETGDVIGAQTGSGILQERLVFSGQLTVAHKLVKVQIEVFAGTGGRKIVLGVNWGLAVRNDVLVEFVVAIIS